jgi:mutual gliding-motility protein MglA
MRGSPRKWKRRSTTCSWIDTGLGNEAKGKQDSLAKGVKTVSLINYSSREINCKIVYYGPGLGGKTSNIQYVYEKLAPETKGKLVTLATEMDRTLFFDFLPLELGEVKGFKTRFHLYTVPGQVYYNASRKLILRGVDGLVFVADSSESRFDANIEALYNLHDNLKEYDLDLKEIPFVMQWNKRDSADALPVAELEEELNPEGYPSFEAVAVNGTGVFDTLKAVAKQVLRQLQTVNS